MTYHLTPSEFLLTERETCRAMDVLPDYIAVCETCGAMLTSKDPTLTIAHTEGKKHIVTTSYWTGDR